MLRRCYIGPLAI